MVSDNGRNWMSTAKRRIFEPFFNAHATTKVRDCDCRYVRASCGSSSRGFVDVRSEHGKELPFRSFFRSCLMRSPKKHGRVQNRPKGGASVFSLSMMKNPSAKFMKRPDVDWLYGIRGAGRRGSPCRLSATPIRNRFGREWI